MNFLLNLLNMRRLALFSYLQSFPVILSLNGLQKFIDLLYL